MQFLHRKKYWQYWLLIVFEKLYDLLKNRLKTFVKKREHQIKTMTFFHGLGANSLYCLLDNPALAPTDTYPMCLVQLQQLFVELLSGLENTIHIKGYLDQVVQDLHR